MLLSLPYTPLFHCCYGCDLTARNVHILFRNVYPFTFQHCCYLSYIHSTIGRCYGYGLVARHMCGHFITVYPLAFSSQSCYCLCNVCHHLVVAVDIVLLLCLYVIIYWMFSHTLTHLGYLCNTYRHFIVARGTVLIKGIFTYGFFTLSQQILLLLSK